MLRIARREGPSRSRAWLLAIVVTAGAFLLAALTSEGIERAHNGGNLLRLHVVAHSNRPYDQDLKLKVRDALLPMIVDWAGTASDVDAVRARLEAEAARLAEIGGEVVRAHGFDYPVAVEIGPHVFPDKWTNGRLVPAGTYDAVRVVIGEGRGQNWWCVLFPPICLGGESDETELVPVDAADGRQTVVWRLKFLEVLQRGGRSLQQWWQASIGRDPATATP